MVGAADMYEIEWVPGGVLRILLAGFWDNAVMSSFVRAVHGAVGRKPAPAFAGLCDISDLLVQSPDMVIRFQDLLGDVRGAGMRRGAMVVTSALLKMQAARAVDPSRTKFVATMAEGMSWIEAMRAADALEAIQPRRSQTGI